MSKKDNRIILTDDERETLEQMFDYVLDQLVHCPWTSDSTVAFARRFTRSKIYRLRLKFFPHKQKEPSNAN